MVTISLHAAITSMYKYAMMYVCNAHRYFSAGLGADRRGKENVHRTARPVAGLQERLQEAAWLESVCLGAHSTSTLHKC